MTFAYPADVPRLTDGTVVLRAMTEADLPAVVEQSTDPETVRWTTVPSPYDLGTARDFLGIVRSGWEDEGGDRTFVIELTSADGSAPAPFAGVIDVRPGARPGASWEVGFATHPAVRGRGAMTGALRLAAEWAFEQGAPSVYWYANVGNWGSRRVAWRAGMTFHGTLPRHKPGRDGRSEDVWCASLLPGQEMTPRTTWIVPPVLEEGPVRLRQLTEADAQDVEVVTHEPHWMPSGGLAPERFAGFLLRRREGASLGRVCGWGIADRSSDRLLGEVCVFAPDGTLEPEGTGELGYQLFPSARGRGIAQAAGRLAVAHAVAPTAEGGLGLRRLVAETAADNEASNAVLRALGFEVYGREIGADVLPDGSSGDGLHWSLARG